MNDPKHRTLLLVEDETLIAQAERLALEGYGYTVLIARSGDQAVEAVRSTPAIDLVLMDIDLGPGIDGTEAAARILKDHDLPIVFLSSHTEPDIVDRVERITSYGYVVKDSSYVVMNASIRMAFRLYEANKEVREKESLLLSMAENYPNSHVSLFDRDMKVGFASGRALKKERHGPAEVLGMSVDQLYGELAPVVREHFERTFTGEERSFELSIDGKHKTIRTVPLLSDGGAINRILVVAEDITERKEAEEVIRLSHETYKGLINSVTEAIYVQDEKGVFLDINERCVDFYGIPREEVIGRTPEFLSAPGMNDLGRLAGNHARAFSGEPQTIEFWGRKADGTPFPKEVTLSPGMYFGQKVVFAVARDITRRKKDEQERWLTNERLLQSEGYLKAIIENSLGSIWAIDREYNVLYVNEVFAREYFAAFHTQLRVGKNILSMLPPPLQEVWKQRYERAINNNEHFVFEDTVETGGACIYIEVSVTPIVVDGQVVGASLYGSNITENKLAEIRIRHETRLRELLIELSTQFINQPLRALESTIQSSLAELGEFVGADRAYVFGYDRAAQTGSNTFEWCREGVTPQIEMLQHVPFSSVDPWVQAHDRGERVHLRCTADLPASSHRELLEAQGIQSLLTIPLMRGKECVGFVGFDSVVTTHTYTEDEQQLLHVYAGMLVNVLERQETEKNLRESEEKYHRLYSLFRLMSDTMPDMLWAKDRDKRFIFANRAFCENLLSAADTAEPLGKTDMFFATRERERHPDDPSWHTFGELCADSDAVTLREMKEMQFDEYGNVKGSFLYLDVHKAPLLNDAGELIGVVGSARDITARKRAEQQVERQLAESRILLKEAHHRIKNNITSIASLLTMQSRAVTNPEAIAILQDAIARVGSMRVLYEKLLNSTSHESAQVKPFVEGLIRTVVELFPDVHRIRIATQIDECELGSKKLFPLGIIITELMTNALKYAFVGRETGEIHLGIIREGEEMLLTMADDGIGLPGDFDLEASEGFGFLLVKVLSAQLDGTYAVESDGGTKCVLRFAR